MSFTRCDKCQDLLDTDSDPDSCVEKEKYDFLCAWCREEEEE